jgi:hypothetical protein
MVPQVPRTANRSRPGVAPPPAWRYRVPEAGNGWIIRPNIEPHGERQGGGRVCVWRGGGLWDDGQGLTVDNIQRHGERQGRAGCVLGEEGHGMMNRD